MQKSCASDCTFLFLVEGGGQQKQDNREVAAAFHREKSATCQLAALNGRTAPLVSSSWTSDFRADFGLFCEPVCFDGSQPRRFRLDSASLSAQRLPLLLLLLLKAFSLFRCCCRLSLHGAGAVGASALPLPLLSGCAPALTVPMSGADG